MSKHWTPRTPFKTRRGSAGRRSRHGSPMRKRRRKAVVIAGNIKLVLLCCFLAGLAYVLVPWNASDLIPSAEADRSTDAMLADPRTAKRLDAKSVAAKSKAANPTVQIIDGDTFSYGGEKIRIADIDTPELRGRCAYETQLAARATRRMDQLLRQGPFELRSVGRDEDRYGRKLRVVTRGGQSLGDQLVAEGLARTWTGRREPWCA